MSHTAEDRIATWCGMILAGGALAAIPLWVGFNGFYGLAEIAVGGGLAYYGFLRLTRIVAVRPRRRRKSKARES